MSTQHRLVLLVFVTAWMFTGCSCGTAQVTEDAIVADLASPDVNVRRTAAVLIRDMRPVPERYIPALVKALDDNDSHVRYLVCEAIGEVGASGRAHLDVLARLSCDHPDPQVRVVLQTSIARINNAR